MNKNKTSAIVMSKFSDKFDENATIRYIYMVHIKRMRILKNPRAISAPPKTHCQLHCYPLPRKHLVRHHTKRSPSTRTACQQQRQEQEQQLETNELEVVPAGLPPIPAPPKFKPFVPHNALRLKMLNYYRQYELPSEDRDTEILIVKALTEPWIEPTAALLADAFADAMGYIAVYKTFLKRQITYYLRTHMDLPPKTCVLVAVLVNKRIVEAQHNEANRSNNSSSINDRDIDDNYEDDDILSSGDGMGISYPSAYDDDDGGADGLLGSLRDRLMLIDSLPPASISLVGAVEVSFSESTRTKDLVGLNPPSDRPYLCNMAVLPSGRLRGIGSRLLAAAEELITAVGESSLYLHLRFKDEPAQYLYRKAGYEATAQDSIFVRLLGQDRRWLMKKVLK